MVDIKFLLLEIFNSESKKLDDSSSFFDALTLLGTLYYKLQ